MQLNGLLLRNSKKRGKLGNCSVKVSCHLQPGLFCICIGMCFQSLFKPDTHFKYAMKEPPIIHILKPHLLDLWSWKFVLFFFKRRFREIYCAQAENDFLAPGFHVTLTKICIFSMLAFCQHPSFLLLLAKID